MVPRSQFTKEHKLESLGFTARVEKNSLTAMMADKGQTSDQWILSASAQSCHISSQ